MVEPRKIVVVLHALVFFSLFCATFSAWAAASKFNAQLPDAPADMKNPQLFAFVWYSFMTLFLGIYSALLLHKRDWLSGEHHYGFFQGSVFWVLNWSLVYAGLWGKADYLDNPSQYQALGGFAALTFIFGLFLFIALVVYRGSAAQILDDAPSQQKGNTAEGPYGDDSSA